MTEVKICGITSLEDGEAAVCAGADAVGFIFHPGSPRCVTADKVREISRKLAGRTCRVGVFVDHELEEVRRIVDFCSLDLIQLHGKESPEYCRGFPPSVLIKAVSFQKEEDLSILEEYSVRAILVDACDPALRGGTGKTCDWNLARKAGERSPLILSGGLNAGNILSAIKTVCPSAVDIGSGLEARPGKKDRKKIMEFMASVKKIRVPGSPSGPLIFPKARL